MTLPDFLHHHPDGEIRLVGHRIGLADVVREYAAGNSAEFIAVRFPSLSLAHIHKVVAFYLENMAEVDAYVAGENQKLSEFESDLDRTRTTPTLAQLRKRFDAVRRAGG